MNDPFEKQKLGAGLDEGDSLEVVRVAANHGPQAIMLPASMRRKLDEEGVLVVADLQHAVRQITKLQDAMDRTVQEAREIGLSWATIGWSVGLTAEGARKKWSDTEEP